MSSSMSSLEFTEIQAIFLREPWNLHDHDARLKHLDAHSDLVNEELTQVIHGLANQASYDGDHATAWAWMEIGTLVVQRLNQPKLIANHLSQQGVLDFRQGALRQALDSWKRALPLYEQSEARGELAACLTNLGIGYRNVGNLTHARECLVRASDMHHDLGNHQSEVLGLDALSMTMHEVGDA